MSDHISPSHEVEHQEALDHLATCTSPTCTFYRHVQGVIANGTPDERRRLLAGLHGLVRELAPHVILDDLRDAGL